MPGERELLQHLFVDFFESEARAELVKHAAMKDIKFGEWNAARPHLVHPRLILRAPRIREREPVESIAQRLEDRLSLTCNPRAPIDHCAEYVEEQRPHA